MKRTAIHVAAAVVAFSLAGPVAAQEVGPITPAKVEAARQIVTGSGMDRSFEALVPTFAARIKQSYVTRPEITKDLDEVLAQVQPSIESKKAELVDTAAKILASRMNEADLKATAAFFTSDAGKAYVAAQPAVLDDLYIAMQDWTNRVFEETMSQVRAEMAKRGHQL
ncbi:DUF2059 domain-containing protein [Chelatococcus composti]|jgi:hypothetical protein|uniref:DUF2059 domain-containing protein n=1 Tax=Chelatococcus composti TaxID=1743235 RepID=A0A841K874_9HYPH|nr:DUF2059 domain-containing protein [Chelatococcus composti]MBB6168280.1 hypothetical protein [Chelatococcus composti]MBS7736636.1 DUF2059 domain-containing protein [Chelatococcus composti]PZN39853.1 MAG: DUF2059 domain-containing protein [Pseudomonadota bacterium]GGG38851.1 hypothetical protein GCM10008026_19660 [Chelatococcus composti]